MTPPSYSNSRAGRITIAYARVSTEDQAREGFSIEAQRARIGAYAAALSFDVPEIIEDAGASAKSLHRPGIATLLDRVRAGGIDRIIVAKLDRLTRSVRDLAEIIELCAAHDVALVSVGETLDTASAAGRMVINMLAAVAQWEREAISERTRDALAAKKRRGERLGRRPVLSPSRLAAAHELLENGHGMVSVARILKVGRSTLYRHLGQMTGVAS